METSYRNVTNPQRFRSLFLHSPDVSPKLKLDINVQREAHGAGTVHPDWTHVTHADGQDVNQSGLLSRVGRSIPAGMDKHHPSHTGDTLRAAASTGNDGTNGTISHCGLSKNCSVVKIHILYSFPVSKDQILQWLYFILTPCAQTESNCDRRTVSLLTVVPSILPPPPTW